MSRQATISALTQRITKFRDARQWKQFHSPKSVAISLVLEAAELAELFQWGQEKELSKLTRKRKQQLADELCDVLYWVLLISNDFNIDLAQHFETKMRKNEKKYPIRTSRGIARKKAP